MQNVCVSVTDSSWISINIYGDGNAEQLGLEKCAGEIGRKARKGSSQIVSVLGSLMWRLSLRA